MRNRKKRGIKIQMPMRPTGRTSSLSHLAMQLVAKDDLQKTLVAAGERFDEYISDLGYTDYTYDIVVSPRMTNRGLLLATGEFTGPSSYGAGDLRPIEDMHTFTFFIVEDTYYKILVLEVKLGGATVATFSVTPKLEPIQSTLSRVTTQLEDTLQKTLTAAGERFDTYISDLGYTDYTYTIAAAPRMTNRGLLLATGEFTGPSPYGAGDLRPVEDVHTFTFYIVEDVHFKILVLEVKLGGATVATFTVTPTDIELLDGIFPHA